MADRARRTLVVMVKAPLPGRAKTRLARDIGTVEALRFYRAATARLLRAVGKDPRWRTVLAVDPPVATAAHWWPRALPRIAQVHGDLGMRMRRALPAQGAVVLVGSDIPGIGAAAIAQAFAALRRADAAVGPAEDGGFWLIGFRSGLRPRHAFPGVRWSGPHALADTLATLEHVRVARLATLWDVDDAAGHARWRGLPARGKPA